MGDFSSNYCYIDRKRDHITLKKTPLFAKIDENSDHSIDPR
jgi:hypothetical protein